MGKFKKGDKVISIKESLATSSQKRKRGEVFTVNEVAYCMSCGMQRINIGKTVEQALIRCICGTTQSNQKLTWTASNGFALATDGSVQKAIIHCLEEEDYEKAAILRDILKEVKCTD